MDDRAPSASDRRGDRTARDRTARDRTRAALEQVVADLAGPLTDRAGLDLVDVSVRGDGSMRVVRVAVDRKGGVTLGECEALSRALDRVLDGPDGPDGPDGDTGGVAVDLPGRYRLEVTSPGVDHPLAGRRAFDRVEGRPVLVHHRPPDPPGPPDPSEGASADPGGNGDEAATDEARPQRPRIEQVRGTVVRAEEDAVVLDVPAGPRGRRRRLRVPYARIEKATQALPW